MIGVVGFVCFVLLRVAAVLAAASSLIVLAACGGGTDEGTSAASQALALPAADSAATPKPERASASTVLSAGSVQQVAADPFNGVPAETVLGQLAEYAEMHVPEHAPKGGSLAAQRSGVLLYRYYPATDTYLAVATASEGDWVLGRVYAAGGKVTKLPVVVDAGLLTNFFTPKRETVVLERQFVPSGAPGESTLAVKTALGWYNVQFANPYELRLNEKLVGATEGTLADIFVISP